MASSHSHGSCARTIITSRAIGGSGRGGRRSAIVMRLEATSSANRKAEASCVCRPSRGTKASSASSVTCTRTPAGADDGSSSRHRPGAVSPGRSHSTSPSTNRLGWSRTHTPSRSTPTACGEALAAVLRLWNVWCCDTWLSQPRAREMSSVASRCSSRAMTQALSRASSSRPQPSAADRADCIGSHPVAEHARSTTPESTVSSAPGSAKASSVRMGVASIRRLSSCSCSATPSRSFCLACRCESEIFRSSSWWGSICSAPLGRAGCGGTITRRCSLFNYLPYNSLHNPTLTVTLTLTQHYSWPSAFRRTIARRTTPSA
eukprot:scaffold60584_cov53-Phaeocystis_antarctica.AAC.5